MGFAFGGLKNAKTSEAGVYLGEGEFKLKVLRCLVGGRKEPLFFAECEVVENKDQRKNDKGEVIDPVGSKRTWCQKLTDKEVGFGALKGFLYACSGLSASDPRHAQQIKEFDEQIEAVAEAAVGPDQALAGLYVRDFVILKESKGKPGQFYHRHTFSPAEG
jgi:hypothetical protein